MFNWQEVGFTITKPVCHIMCPQVTWVDGVGLKCVYCQLEWTVNTQIDANGVHTQFHLLPYPATLTLTHSACESQQPTKKNVKISIFSFWLAKISPCMWWYTHIYLMKRTLSLLTLKESDFLVAYSEIQYPQCLLTIMITRNQSDDDQWYTGCFLPIRSRDNFRLQNFRRSLYRY